MDRWIDELVGLRAVDCSVDAWLHGCMAAWLRGCVAAWLRGCVAAWLRGCGCVAAFVRINQNTANDVVLYIIVIN